VDLKMDIIGLDTEDDKEREQKIARLAREEAQLPFDLGRAPLLRAKLLRFGEQYHVLLLTMHHIISDGWSLGVVVQEVTLFYGAIRSGESSPLPELPIQYGDFSTWQRDWLQGDVLTRQMDYWTAQLDGVAVLEVPVDHPRPAMQTEDGSQEHVELEPELVRGLRKLAWDEGVTLYMVLLAAFQLLLYRYAAQQDIAVGAPIAGRRRTETEGLIGFFVNTVVIRTRFQDHWSVRDLLAKVKETTLQAYEHQDAPFEKLVEVLTSQRDLSRTPLFQVMFALQNAPFPLMRLGTAQFQAFQVDGKTSKFDQSLVLEESGDSIRGYLEYSTDLWEATSIASMIRRFRLVLREMIETPTLSVSRLPIMDDTERAELLEGWSGRKIAGLQETTLSGKIAEWAEQQPDAVALLADGTQLTYRDLNIKADRLASRMLREGIQTQVPVGLYLDRAADLITAVLAVLKCGAIMVPLDVADPPARISLILQDAGIAWIIAEGKSAARLPETMNIIHADAGEGVPVPEGSPVVNEVISLESAACILYRSSPAGKPQGIVLKHRSLVPDPYAQDLQLNKSDRVAQSLNFSSDVSCPSFFAALCAGACLVSIPYCPPLAPRKLAELLQQSSATVLLAPAAMLERLASEFLRAVRTMRLLVCEDMIPAVGRLREVLKPEIAERVYAMYGSAEVGGSCVLASLSKITLENRVPLHHLASGTKLYILDGEQEPVPEGVVGEIYVQREDQALAAGYLNDARRTGSSFVSLVAGQGMEKPLYRTGEMACHRTDGTLEFRGRQDGRVSIGGVRIEMEEIEAALRDHAGIRAAAGIWNGRAATALTAWVSFEDQSVSEEELERFLRERLPQVMVPSKFRTIDDIPRTASGVVDRMALALKIAEREHLESSAVSYVAPRNPVEEQLAGIWAQTLRTDRIGIHDNFFRRGGHSLMAAQVIARMSDAFRTDIPLRRLFESPTIAEMGKVIEELTTRNNAGGGAVLPPIQRRTRGVVSIPDSE
jgi:amino acid adenylation domain-containing protein